MSKTKLPSQNDIERELRRATGKVVAALVARFGDIQDAEDAFQDACAKALQVWPTKGLPNKPIAWLLTVAQRRIIDQRRRRKPNDNAHEIHQRWYVPNQIDEASELVPDERLKLIFTCCHPCLDKQSQTALTLKVVCGLSVREIARAFVVSESAMQQRLQRAKAKIRIAKVPYKVPNAEELSERLEQAREVIYLIYNESYSSFEGGDLTREDLANEARRLAELLSALNRDPESAGLLALLCLNQSRHKSRLDNNNELVTLKDQDRRQWDTRLINQGLELLNSVLPKGLTGRYQLQAAISAIYAESQSWQSTDWPQIILLYKALYQLEPTPTVELNLVVAIAHSGNPKIALNGLKRLQPRLDNYQPYWASRAAIEASVGLKDEADSSYEQALALTKNQIEKRFLESQQYQLRDGK